MLTQSQFPYFLLNHFLAEDIKKTFFYLWTLKISINHFLLIYIEYLMNRKTFPLHVFFPTIPILNTNTFLVHFSKEHGHKVEHA